MLTKVQGIFHNTTKAMRVTLLILYDVMAVLLAEFLALWTRFEFHFSQITPTYLENACKYAAVNILITVAVFAFLKLYSSLLIICRSVFDFSKDNAFCLRYKILPSKFWPFCFFKLIMDLLPLFI